MVNMLKHLVVLICGLALASLILAALSFVLAGLPVSHAADVRMRQESFAANSFDAKKFQVSGNLRNQISKTFEHNRLVSLRSYVQTEDYHGLSMRCSGSVLGWCGGCHRMYVCVGGRRRVHHQVRTVQAVGGSHAPANRTYQVAPRRQDASPRQSVGSVVRATAPEGLARSDKDQRLSARRGRYQDVHPKVLTTTLQGQLPRASKCVHQSHGVSATLEPKRLATGHRLGNNNTRKAQSDHVATAGSGVNWAMYNPRLPAPPLSLNSEAAARQYPPGIRVKPATNGVRPHVVGRLRSLGSLVRAGGFGRWHQREVHRRHLECGATQSQDLNVVRTVWFTMVQNGESGHIPAG